MGVPSSGNWGDEPTVPTGTAPATGVAPPTTTTTTTGGGATATTTPYNQDDWMGAAGTTTTKDWGADDGGDWGAAEPKVTI